MIVWAGELIGTVSDVVESGRVCEAADRFVEGLARVACRVVSSSVLC